jgi:hypothetical protein
MKWHADRSQFFTARAFAPQGTYNLSVERLPGPGWDWVTWRSLDAVLDGVAETAEAAMIKAEAAVSELLSSLPPLSAAAQRRDDAFPRRSPPLFRAAIASPKPRSDIAIEQPPRPVRQ